MDPLLIEKQYQDLKQSLRLILSKRLKLAKITDFIDLLVKRDSQTFLAAYADELWPQVSSLILQTDFTGTPLAFLHRLEASVDYLTKGGSDLSEDKERVLLHLTEQREEITRRMQSRGAQTEEHMRDANTVWIPVAEYEPLLAHTTSGFGSLLQLHADVAFTSKAGAADEFHISQYADHDILAHDRLRASLTAAKHLLHTFAQVDLKKRLIVRCWFSGKEGTDTPSLQPGSVIGESLEAGLTALLFTELLRLCQHREEYSVRPNVAITGGIDEKGNLLPVDEEALRMKMETCNHSWIRYLVVPQEQEDFCRRFEDSPAQEAGSPIEIVGTEKLEDIFYNRRLTGAWRVPKTRQATRKLWKWRGPIAAMVFLVLAAIIGKLWYGPIDREPVGITFEGEMMRFQNKHGETLEDYQLGFNAFTVYGTDRFWEFSALQDVDGDGVKEAVWIQPPYREGAGSWVVCCKTFGEDTLRWKASLQRKLVFPSQGETAEHFRARMLFAGDFDADGSVEIIVIAFHDHFPAYVVKLDGSTGETNATYVHAGHLNHGAALDLDNDGIQEILMAGINNAYNEASLVVLDPRFIEGHGPLTDAFRVEGFAPGLERAYILIPRTIVGKAIRIERYSRGAGIDTYPESKEFRVVVNDQSEDLFYKATIYGLFGFDLRPKSFTTGNDYDVTAARLLSEGRISRFPDKAYFDEFKKTLRYWDGEGWRNEPVVNKRYLEKLREYSASLAESH